MKIAFLEDEESSASSVIAWLEAAGHEVDWFKRGQACLRALPDGQYDLCLFDWMLPDMNGPEVMANLLLKGAMPPVIFLTGRDAEEDVVQVIQAGADDYIVKPPSKNILLARIQAVVRRSTAPTRTIEAFGRLRVDFYLRRFELDGVAVNLTEKESELALYFFSHVGALMSRAHLIQIVWGTSAEIDTRTVDVHISHLRSKLKLTPESGWRLVSVYQQGYRLERTE